MEIRYNYTIFAPNWTPHYSIMDEQTINEQHNSIIALLKGKRLKEAQTQLTSMLATCPDWTLHNRLEQAQTSYNYMLQYMKQGVDDPERGKLYIKLLARHGLSLTKHD